MNAKRGLVVASLLLGFLASAYAQSRPGIDRPIRVGMFKGTGTGSRYWHTSQHPGAAAIAAMLGNPGAADLNNPILPPKGFTTALFGPVEGAECPSSSGCNTPTTEQRNAFIAALDTLDVVIVMNFVDIGSNITSMEQRLKIADFWKTKGLISLHQSNDQGGLWSDWLGLGITRFRTHPPEMQATIRIDTQGDATLHPDRFFLNQGLSDSARFTEEWIGFMHDGANIRSGGYARTTTDSNIAVTITTQLDETTFELAVDSSRIMKGDHPMSWARRLPEGGRFFYTGLGHRREVYDTVRFFRRQIYNAILWTAKYDSLSTVSIAPGVAPSSFKAYSSISTEGPSLIVSTLHDGPHGIEIRGLDGRKVEARRGVGRARYDFAGLRAGVYVVNVDVEKQRTSNLVRIP